LAHSPQVYFGNQDGKGDEQNTEQINKYKRTSAIFTGNVGKLPDISEANRSAD
jgi:hypothetical protein